MMEEAYKAVLKWKIVHDNKIIPVHDKIRDHNNNWRLENFEMKLWYECQMVEINTNKLKAA